MKLIRDLFNSVTSRPNGNCDSATPAVNGWNGQQEQLSKLASSLIIPQDQFKEFIRQFGEEADPA